jgi:hypothetical protein
VYANHLGFTSRLKLDSLIHTSSNLEGNGHKSFYRSACIVLLGSTKPIKIYRDSKKLTLLSRWWSNYSSTWRRTAVCHDAILYILSRMLVKAVCQFLAVSRAWCDLISSLTFLATSTSHANRSAPHCHRLLSRKLRMWPTTLTLHTNVVDSESSKVCLDTITADIVYTISSFPCPKKWLPG